MTTTPITLIEAITQALAWELEHDPSVLVLGEDVGVNGGVFRATAGLQQRFGSRVVAEQLRDSLLQASEGDLAAAQRAVQAGDRQAAALHLHRQAGGLGAIGATALAQQANALVERLHDAAEADTAPLFATVTTFVARLQKQLQRLAH